MPSSRLARTAAVAAAFLIASSAAALAQDGAAGAEAGATQNEKLAELEKEVRDNERDGLLLAEYGYELVRAGREDEGITALARAEAFEPDDPRVLLYSSRAYYTLERYQEAAIHALKVSDNPLASRGEQSEAYYIAGSSRLRLGDLTTATDLLRQATRLDPGYARAMMNLGLALYAQKRHTEGLSALQRAADRSPDDVEIQIRIADVFDAMGRHDASLPLRERVAKLAPDDRNAHVAVARAYLMEQRLEDAIAHYERACEIDSDNGTLQHALARLLIRADRYEDAVVAAERAIELGEDASNELEIAQSRVDGSSDS